MNYNEYTAVIQRDPSYYGSECSYEDAHRIADSLTGMVKVRFPGVEVCSSGPWHGPDTLVIDEIRDWVQKNWTAAL